MSEERVMRFAIGAVTGWDLFLKIILPWSWFLRRVAKKVKRSIWPASDPAVTILVLETERGPYRILDNRGRTEPYKGELVRI